MRQIDGFDEMPHRGGIGTAQCIHLLDSGTYPLMTMRSNEAQHLDHLACAAGLAVPLDKLAHQPIITRRQESALPPRGQWLRTDQRTRLALQHVEIMFEIEHLLMTLVAALVARD